MKYFYTLSMPVLWLSVAVISYFHHGDEYGIFVISSFAGCWILFLLGDVANWPYLLLIIYPTGVVSMAALGFLMDKLRVSKRLWAVLWFFCAILLLAYALLQYPSLDRAIRKNGSLTAYIAGAANLGLYASILLSAVITATIRIRKHLSARAKARDVAD